MTGTDTLLRRPVIDAALPEGLRAAIAAHPARPVLLDRDPAAPPWDVADGAELLLTGPDRWDRAPAAPPPGWPFGLRQIGILSAGVDRFPDWALGAVPVTCGRGITADPIAEYVMAAILNREKRLVDHLRGSPLNRFGALGSLSGKTLGLIGTGAIGRAVARRAAAFGMNVVGTSRRRILPADSGISLLSDPVAVAEVSDHLVLALPLTPATAGLISPALLSQLKPGAHLINVARGGLVDQDALVAALDSGQIGFATLDVTDPEPLPENHPLAVHPKALITPHISWSGETVDAAMLDRLTREVGRFAAGLPPLDRVDPAYRY